MGACLSGSKDGQHDPHMRAPPQGPPPPAAPGARQRGVGGGRASAPPPPHGGGRGTRQTGTAQPRSGAIVAADTHNASASIRNGTLKVKHDGGGGFEITCLVDSNADDAVVHVHAACCETGGPPDGPAVVFHPQPGLDAAASQPLPPQPVPRTTGHPLSLRVHVPPAHLVSDAAAGRYPLVLSVAIGNGTEQRLAYVQLASATSTPDLTRHVLVRGSGMYLLRDVYGEQEDAAECVVCMCEAPAAVVMPCRHKCVCVGCAEELKRMGGQKCPMCRAGIQYYVTAK